MAKYTFRFHTHGWIDITVDAKDEEEAYQLADDKYCEGDYEDQPENFENTHVELIEE